MDKNTTILIAFAIVVVAITVLFISGVFQGEGPPVKGEETPQALEEELEAPLDAEEEALQKKKKEWKEAHPEDEKWVPQEVDLSISWESMNGPPGGRVDQLIQNPYRHNELYATTRHGLYKSGDKGESWQKIDGSEKASIAVFEDKLFFCMDGVYYYDNNGNPVKILDKQCHAITVSDNKLFVTSGGGKISDAKILYADLASGNFDWKDVSPSVSRLGDLVLPPEDTDFKYGIRVQGIVALGNIILANIIVEGGDRGGLTKSHLYRSEDLGGTWSTIELGEPDGVSIAKIAQNPDNPRHLVLSFRHNIVHEGSSPISELLRESYDGGKTWNKPTGLTLESDEMGKGEHSNGIEDVVILGSAYYLLSPYGGPSILKLEGSSYEQIPAPRLEEFERVGFNLDTLLFDFDDPNIVYGKAGSIWALGILKSEDGMKTWKKMDGDIIASCPTIILTHPTEPSVIFTSGNVIQESYATRDGGETWEPFSPVAAGDDVRIDPHNPEHILLVDELTDIYESYDSGRTFTQIAEDFSSAKIFDFEIVKDGSGKIYTSNIGVGISEASLQGGWRYLTYSPDYAYDIEIDPEDSNIVYATYSPKIFENHSSVWRYSPDQTENSGWSEILRIEDSRGITSLAFDELNPDNIYAGVVGKEGTIYVSNDKGENWNKLSEDLSFTTIWGHSQLQIDPTNKNTVYAGTWGGGSYKTTDGGTSWTLLDEDHTFSPVCLAISSKDPNIVYACDRTAPKIHRSTDAGETWTEYYDFGEGYMLSSAIAIDPDNPDRIYASAFKPPMAHEGGLVKITNGQATPIGEDLPRSVLEIEIDPANKNIIYATIHIHGVYKSEDAGVTWEKLDDKNNGLPRIGVYDVDVDLTNSNTLYATALCGELPAYMMPPPMLGVQNLDPDGKCGVYRSINAGETWELLLETISEARGIDVDPEDNNNLYVADMMGGVWVSNDGGANWRQENEGLGSISMTSVKVKDDYIYASTQGSGIYAGQINSDGSITWDRSRSNKPKAEIARIQIKVDPNDSNKIYASANAGGLLRSDDGGVHWNDKNFLTPSIKVEDPSLQGYYSFDINPDDSSQVWLSVYGKGVFYSLDGMDYNMFANGQNNEMFGKYLTSVAISPTNPNEIYVAGEEGVFVTKDGGRNWEGMNDGLKTLHIRSLRIVSMEYPPLEDDFEDGNADGWKSDAGWSVIEKHGNHVLQGTGHNWISAGSESWSDYTFESRVKLFDASVHINYRVSGGERYAVGINDENLYLMKSSAEKKDSGHTDLESINMQFHNDVWYDIKIVGKGNNIKVYVNDILKIDYTDDEPILNGGVAFESLQEQIHVDNVVITIDSTDAEIYAGTSGYGIYKFNHISKEWQSLGKTFGGGWWSPWERRMYQFSSILFDPDVPGRVYYGHFPSGFFISEDNGHTWRDSSLKLGNDGMFSLSMHPHNHSILFAGTYNGVVKSVDRGRTWEIISSGIPPEQWPYTVAIDDENPNIMYTSTKNGQNKGFCERNNFCGVVMKTIDGGGSWFMIMDGLYDRSEFYTLLIYPPNHNILFLSTNRGVYISRDAGDSWKSINTGLSSTDNQVRDNVADNLALTPDNKYLIFGLMDSGAWKADLSNAGLGS